MYLVVFVTILVAVIGAFTQIYTKQAAMMSDQQTGVAQAMVQWHATAVALAEKYLVKSALPAIGAGCSLTSLSSSAVPTGLSYCKGPSSVDVYVGMTTGTDCSGAQGAPCVTRLPNGILLSSTVYKFYSIVGRITNGKYYVLTYVPPTVASASNFKTGFLCLPGDITLSGACPSTHAQFSMTFDRLFKQIVKNSHAAPLFYGTSHLISTTNYLVTPVIRDLNDGAETGERSYEILGTKNPSGYYYVPVDSVGLITSFSPCSACT